MDALNSLVITYSQILPYFGLALIISLLATPLVGRLAERIGAMDLPASLRKKTEDSGTRINTKVTARLGGLSIVIAIAIVLFLSDRIGFSSLSTSMAFNSWGIWLGVFILTLAGIYDDSRDMPAWAQFLAQFVAAILVVISGVKLDDVVIGNEFIQSFDPLVAKGIIVFWIVAMINFVNWASGIDALHGALTSVAGATLLLIAMQNGNPVLATIIAVHLGANLGVLPYNYHPSKIFYGFGESINGFLLAVFAISGDVKFATSLVILGLPLIDAIWVAVNRMRRKMKETKNPIKILVSPMKGDKTHLHHRLLELGYSWKTVVLFELIIMITFSIAAFYFSGFSIQSRTIQLALTALGLVFIFIVINVARNRVKDQKLRDKLAGMEEPTVQLKILDASAKDDEPEEKYIY